VRFEADCQNSKPKVETTLKINKTTSDDVKQVSLFDELPVRTPKTVATPTGNIWGSTSIDQILAWLDDKGDWFGKTAILAGCGASESDWESAIAELLKDGDVVSQDFDGITRYRAVE
jgi:hypothetical protein